MVTYQYRFFFWTWVVLSLFFSSITICANVSLRLLSIAQLICFIVFFLFFLNIMSRSPFLLDKATWKSFLSKLTVLTWSWNQVSCSGDVTYQFPPLYLYCRVENFQYMGGTEHYKWSFQFFNKNFDYCCIKITQANLGKIEHFSLQIMISLLAVLFHFSSYSHPWEERREQEEEKEQKCKSLQFNVSPHRWNRPLANSMHSPYNFLLQRNLDHQEKVRGTKKWPQGREKKFMQLLAVSTK